MNNVDLYNAVISGISGATQNFRSGVTSNANYTLLGDRAVLLALRVDDGIAPTTISQSDTFLMAQIVAGLDFNRSLLGTTPNYQSIANDIIKMWTEFRGRIIPNSNGALMVEVDTIAALRLLPFNPALVFVKRYDRVGSEPGGGTMVYRAGNLTADNGGTWFTTAAGGHYERDGWANGPVNAQWWGGVGDWDPSTDTGGNRDNVAIVGARDWAQSNNKDVYIPAGPKAWIIDTTRVHVDHNTRIFGDGWQKTIIATKLSAGIYVGSGAYGSSVVDFVYNWQINDFSIVYFGGDNAAPAVIDCLIDIVASAQGKIFEIGLGGRVKYGINSVRTGEWPLDVRGENYFLETKLRTARPIISGLYPLRYDWMIKNHGAANGSTISGHCQLPLQGGAWLGGNPGDEGELEWGNTIRIVDFQVEGDNTPGTIGIRGLSLINVSIDHCYGEGMGTIIDFTACKLIYFQGTYGATNYFRQCRGVTAGQNYCHNEYLGCTGVTELTGGSFSPDPKALGMDNLSVITLGHGNESGVNNAHPVVGFVQTDPLNLAVNGDFERWISSTTPWGWKAQGGYIMKMTQCGVGLTDTTHSAGARYSSRIQGNTIQYLKITNALGDQYLGTTIAVSIKTKIIASYLAAAIVPATSLVDVGSRVLSATNTWIPCNDEDGTNGWRLCTFDFVITADMCTEGIALKLTSIIDTDAYIDEIMVSFGVACPRSFVPCERTIDGLVTVLQGGRIQLAQDTVPGETDPFVGQAYQLGDRCAATLVDICGWYRDVGSWVAVNPDKASAYAATVKSIAGAKLKRMFLGDDLGPSGLIALWAARQGANGTPVAAGSPSVGSLRGNKAAVFSAGATAQGISFEGACADYWAVARWDGALPFTQYNGVISGATTAGVGQRIMGSLGTSNMFEFASTVTKNGVHDTSVQVGVTAIWRAYGPAGIDPREVGGANATPLGNWEGPISVAIAFDPVLTDEEAAAILAATKTYSNI